MNKLLTIIGLILIIISILIWLFSIYITPKKTILGKVLFYCAIVLITISQLIKDPLHEHLVTKKVKPIIPKTYAHIWISMTTIPERLTHEWFRNNLLHTIDMAKVLDATIILQIPTKSTKNVIYNVPENIKSLESKYFKINNCGIDEGPITKILPVLRDQNIHPTDDIIIVCDDDIYYKNDTFIWLVKSALTQKDAVHVMCSKTLEGYQGFAFRKNVLEGLLNIHRPSSCFRIDDDVIEEYIRQHKIELVVAKKGEWNCSMSKTKTDSHPEWFELKFDDRVPLVKQCIKDLGKLV